MKQLLFCIPFLFSVLACNSQPGPTHKHNSQNHNIMPEKFDVALYKKYQESEGTLALPNGYTVLSMTAPEGNEAGAQQELLPNPSFLISYKEFYADGSLRKKEVLLSETVKVMQSEYYSASGQLERTVNEEEKFGKIKYPQVLAFLDEKGYIDIKKGTGRLNENGTPKYDIHYDAKSNTWTIILTQGKKLSEKEFLDLAKQSPGEPNPWKPVYYIMDGNTGAAKEVDRLPQ
ncbi:MAG: hypothetical protein BGO31_19310 [Bacteroidetes bacterium 43-16]|nr:MAG: hypothetical protein BGO31_19310 [Bacteroidetes bacterium 43-16]